MFVSPFTKVAGTLFRCRGGLAGVDKANSEDNGYRRGSVSIWKSLPVEEKLRTMSRQSWHFSGKRTISFASKIGAESIDRTKSMCTWESVKDSTTPRQIDIQIEVKTRKRQERLPRAPQGATVFSRIGPMAPSHVLFRDQMKTVNVEQQTDNSPNPESNSSTYCCDAALCQDQEADPSAWTAKTPQP